MKGQYTFDQVRKELPPGPARDALIQLFEIEFSPTREELLGYEYVRQSGKFNMLTEAALVMNMLHVIGAFKTLNWLARCSKSGISYFDALNIAYKFHEDIHVDDETALKFKMNEAHHNVMIAQEQLRNAQEEIKNLRVRNDRI